MELQEIIAMTKRLCQAPGTSGREDGAAAVAEELLAPLGPVSKNPLGSVLCTVNEGEPGAPHLMLEAHLDQIGMVVTRLEKGGFLRVANVGGLDCRLLPASPVTVHAKGGRYSGVISSTPPHLCDGKEKPPKMEDILVDTGLSDELARETFAPGDPITLDGAFALMANDRMLSPCQDDRVGCVAVIAAAKMIRESKPKCKVTVCLSAQEETSGYGAGTAAFALAPDMALLVDVSFGVGAGAGSNGTKNSASGAGGLGGKMTPSAVLVIKNGGVKLVNIKNQDAVTKVLDMVPDLIEKFTKPKDKEESPEKEEEISDADVVDIAFPEGEASK